jgi:hypothetical protein
MVDRGQSQGGGSPKLCRSGDAAHRWSPRGAGERERKEQRCRGCLHWNGEAAKSAGGKEALQNPLELDAAMFWAWRREAIGGDGRGVEWWCSRGLYIGWSRGEEAVR